MIVAQLCTTLCDPMDYSLLGSSVHGILQARILEGVAISFFRRPFPPRDQIRISFFRRSFPPRDQIRVSCIAGRLYTIWATREACGDLAKSSLRTRALKPRHLACRHLARTTLGEVEGPWAGIHTTSRHKQNLGAWHHMITNRPVLTVQMRLRMSGGHGRPLSRFSKTQAPGQHPSTGSLSTPHKCIFCLPKCV